MITPVQGAGGTVEIGRQKLTLSDWKVEGPYQIPAYAPGSQRPRGPRAKRSYANLSREAALYSAGYVKTCRIPLWEWTTPQVHKYLMEVVETEIQFRVHHLINYTDAQREDLVQRYVQGRYPFYFPPDVKPGGLAHRTV